MVGCVIGRGVGDVGGGEDVVGAVDIGVNVGVVDVDVGLEVDIEVEDEVEDASDRNEDFEVDFSEFMLVDIDVAINVDFDA